MVGIPTPGEKCFWTICDSPSRPGFKSGVDSQDLRGGVEFQAASVASQEARRRRDEIVARATPPVADGVSVRIVGQ